MDIKIEVAGVRLDKALAELTPLSRSVANEQIKEGKVRVNGEVKKAKYTVKEGDIIQYEVPEVEEVSYEAEDLPLDIVYEDQDVVVVRTYPQYKRPFFSHRLDPLYLNESIHLTFFLYNFLPFFSLLSDTVYFCD